MYKHTRASQTGNTTLLVIGIAIIAVLVGLFVQTGMNKPKKFPEFSKTIILPNPKNIKFTEFTDHTGNSFNKAQFDGKWTILFFGFTNCPDICPSTLQTLSKVKLALQNESVWSNYQVVMISVDPETDTVDRLASYVPYFDSEFIGLNADIEATKQFAKQVGVLFVKRENDNGAAYEVDHSASIILIDPQGRWAGAISAPHTADSISADLIKLAKFTGPVTRKTKNEKPAQSTSKKADQKSPNTSIHPDTQAALTINQAWIRPAPPNVTAMAAYFEISNNTNQDIQIVDSNSSAFDMTMIHNTVIEGGVAKMVHMDGLTVPANGQVKLAPLSTHMMLMRPESPLKEGDTVDITLIDENDNEYDYQINVRQAPNTNH